MSGQPRRFLRRIMLYVPLFQPFFLYFVGTIVVSSEPDVPVERALHDRHHCSNIAIPMRIRQLGIINGFPGITVLDGQPIGSHPQPQAVITIDQHAAYRSGFHHTLQLLQSIPYEIGFTGIGLGDAATNHPHPHQSLAVAQHRRHFIAGNGVFGIVRIVIAENFTAGIVASMQRQHTQPTAGSYPK